MRIVIRGAREHNLQGVDVEFGEGLTVVTGVSGSGKTSLVFDTLYHEARRRFLDIYSIGSAGARLAPANVETITGLGPAIAVGQNLLNRNPASTLATASGLHPFLRLLYAHFGERACTKCGTRLIVLSEDQMVERLANLAHRETIIINAPLLNGVIGSHRTLLNLLEQQYAVQELLVDGAPWQGQALDASAAHSLEIHIADLDSSDSTMSIRQAVHQAAALGVQAIKVYSRSIQPEDRTDGKPGALPPGQMLARAPVCTSCGAWFGDITPPQFHSACPHCEGKGCSQCGQTGLPPAAAAVRWQGLRINELLALSVDETAELFSNAEPASTSTRLLLEIRRRIEALQRVGLGYIGLDRPSPSLSRGEAQRVRLALSLISRLEDMLHILDEPTVGQHPADVRRLLPAFRELAGPVVFVEHDRLAAAGADRAVDLGPGAGREGGQVVFDGSPQELWQAGTATGLYFSGRARLQPPAARPAPSQFLTVRGGILRNLQNIDVSIPVGRFTVVTGISGSGKSTLVEDVLAASLLEGKAVGCRSLEGALLKAVMVDQSPIGRNPRSNPATYTKLADLIRDLFAAATGLSPSHFSFNRPEGACPACSGLGAVEVAMRYLPSTWIPCAECEGQRFSDEVLAARVDFGDGLHRTIADFFSLTVAEIVPLIASQPYLPPANRQAALRILEALQEIGLGYITLGQPSPTLSGGEAQRVKLARHLGSKSLARQLLILDEPSTGLHPQDLAGLLGVLNRLVSAGATVLVVEHNTDMIRAADWVIDLGPGAGPKGGRLLYAGPPAGLLDAPQSLTGEALRAEADLQPGAPTAPTFVRQPSISIRGAQAHNLKNVDVDFPKNALTVVTGVSGSGKSSLVHDVLESEARRRFLETLSMYERQGTREGAEAEVETVSGLGVALTVTPERLVYARRATVGVATEISHHLAALFATAGERACLSCGAAMRRGSEEWECSACQDTAPFAQPRHFFSSTYAAACLHCNGVGTLQMPRPEKLIIHPEKPLCNGAMYSPGFFPNGYLGKPYNGGYYLVQALGRRFGFNPQETSWNEMSVEAQHAFLYGCTEKLDVIGEGRSGRTYRHQSTFPGFYGFIRDWDVGGMYTEAVACPQCQGTRFRPEYLAVHLGGYNIHQLSQMPLWDLVQVMDHLPPFNERTRLAAASLSAIHKRLHFLIQVGLGYLHLGRVAGSLSAGEVQRVRLAGLLGSGLTSLTLLLDEPSRGLHPAEVQALVAALRELRNEGNTVIVVEHDPLLIRSADHLIDMGPEAGDRGGEVVVQGSSEQVAAADSLTARWLRGERKMELRSMLRSPRRWMIIRGARANNLQNITVRFPLQTLVGVCGVSGSGKSTLLIDTLGRVLAPKKQTTSVAHTPIDPGEHDAIEGAPGRVLLVDQTRAGVSSPAAYLNLLDPLRKLFASCEDALALGLSEEQLSPRCSTCGGSGVITLDMAFLPDLHQPCETCRGSGYLPESWEARLQGLALPEVMGLTVNQVYDLFGEDERLARPLRAARDVGLGYLVLRQPGYALSGGEAQRLKIADELYRKIPAGTLYILDEPSVGQHLEDVARLAGVLHRLVDEGGSVIIIEHHAHLLASCDWLIELGPGGGPTGGYLVAEGTPHNLARGNTPIAPYLREILEITL